MRDIFPKGLPKDPVIGKFLRIKNTKILLFSGFEKILTKVFVSFVVFSVSSSSIFEENIAQP